MSTFLYTCVATAETMEPAATPITDPAMPIFADSRNEVTAASAPAKIDENDMPLKKFFTEHDGSRLCSEKLAIL